MTPIKQWAAKRGLGLTKTYQLLKAGLLHGRKLGKKTYITDEEDARFIASLPAYTPTTGGNNND